MESGVQWRDKQGGRERKRKISRVLREDVEGMWCCERNCTGREDRGCLVC